MLQNKNKICKSCVFPLILRGLRAGFSEAVPDMITVVQEEERGRGKKVNN